MKLNNEFIYGTSVIRAVLKLLRTIIIFNFYTCSEKNKLKYLYRLVVYVYFQLHICWTLLFSSEIKRGDSNE